MNTWNDAVALFSSLSKSEKRHFKLLASLQDGEKKYLTLFDELEKMPVAANGTADWNEDYEGRLKSRLLRKGVGGQLHVLRNYLTGMVLKSLRIQEENRTAADEARARLREGVLLQRKGLFPMAIGKFEDARVIAREYELFEVELEACTHLCYLKSQQSPKNYREEMEAVCRALETAARQLELETRYRALHYRVFVLGRMQANPNDPEFGELLRQYAADPLLTAAPEGFQAEAYRLQILANIAYTRRDKALTKSHYRSILDLWERHPRQQTERLRLYMVAIANYLNLCISAGDWSDFEFYLDKLKSLQPVFFDDKAEAFQNIALAEQLYFLNTAQLDNAEAMIPYIEQGLTEYRRKVNRAREIVLRHNILTTWFAVGKYEAALGYSQALANLGKSEHRVDIQSMVGIWRLIFHFELGNHKYLDQMVKNVAQNLRDNDRFFDFERLVLSHINRIVQVRMKVLPAAEERAALQTGFQLFREDIRQFAEKSGAVKILGLDEVSVWVECHCSGKTFVEILRER